MADAVIDTESLLLVADADFLTATEKILQLPPLLPRDQVVSVRIFGGSQPSQAIGYVPLIAAIYSTSKKPATLAEAKLGNVLMAPTSFPVSFDLMTQDVGVSAFIVAKLDVPIPLIHRPYQRDRFLSVSITAPGPWHVVVMVTVLRPVPVLPAGLLT